MSAAWHPPEELPLLGRSHHLVIADTDAKALRLLRPAYREWFAKPRHLWRAHGVRVPPGLPTTRTRRTAPG